MKTTSFALTLVLVPALLVACDPGDEGAISTRAKPSLHGYKSTRVAHTLEGAGGDLQWIQFIANGVSQDPASMQFVDLGAPAICDGNACTLTAPFACLEERFGRDLAAQQAALDELIADSLERFGADLTDPAHYLIFPYEAREDVGIRAMAMSGIDVPAEGFAVHDCGLQAVGIDGVSIPLVHGAYRIDADPNPGHALAVILDYRLREPILRAVGHGGAPISVGRYDLHSDVYGDGLAEFVVASECEGTFDPLFGVCIGTIHHNIRNTITFSDRGGL
ncbi:MAG: hypothetical protein R3B09_30350 [Nannocystaceae bacterium]